MPGVPTRRNRGESVCAPRKPSRPLFSSRESSHSHSRLVGTLGIRVAHIAEGRRGDVVDLGFELEADLEVLIETDFADLGELKDMAGLLSQTIWHA
jgi:hypothetical protein